MSQTITITVPATAAGAAAGKSGSTSQKLKLTPEAKAARKQQLLKEGTKDALAGTAVVMGDQGVSNNLKKAVTNASESSQQALHKAGHIRGLDKMSAEEARAAQAVSAKRIDHMSRVLHTTIETHRVAEHERLERAVTSRISKLQVK
jgi:hypothetical protein